MHTYRGYVAEHYDTAQAKGTIFWPSRSMPVKGIRFELTAKNNEEAYKMLCAQFRPEDKRPLAGKAYLAKCKNAEFPPSHECATIN